MDFCGNHTEFTFILWKMHSFRLRYVVLGLLIYLQNAFCRTCGSDLDDIASKVVISDIVFEGRLSDLVDKSNGEFVYEYKPGEVYRGEENLAKSRRDPEKYRTVPVGIFQGNCTAEVDRTKKYIVFLKNNVNEEFYEWTVLPLQASRKVKKEIQKTVDCLPKCGELQLQLNFYVRNVLMFILQSHETYYVSEIILKVSHTVYVSSAC